MKKYLIPNEGIFYKANLHSHSTVSDGCNTPEEMKEYYKAHEYDVLAITDHELLVNHSHLSDENFLVIPGYEYAICELGEKCFEAEGYIRSKTIEFNLYPKDPNCEKHILFNPDNVIHGEKFRAKTAEHYGDYAEREYSVEFAQKLIDEAKEHGFLISLNHPSLSFESWDFYKQLKGLCAMEIHNQASFYNYCEYNSQMYDALLRSGMRLNITSSDDSHAARVYDDENDKRPWGFTMIKAKELTHTAIIKAMEKGDMYATQGPFINELYTEGNKVHIKFSDAKVAVIKYDLRVSQFTEAKNGEYINEAVFDIYKGVKYFRFTIIDEFGRHADTRAYYI